MVFGMNQSDICQMFLFEKKAFQSHANRPLANRKCLIMKKFEHLRGYPCTVKSQVQGKGGGFMRKSITSWEMVTWELPYEQTENFRFPQLCWRAVIILETTTSCIGWFQRTFPGYLRLPFDISGSFLLGLNSGDSSWPGICFVLLRLSVWVKFCLLWRGIPTR